jgi:hypothetical protein
VVEVGERGEEVAGARGVRVVRDDEAVLARALDLEMREHRPVAARSDGAHGVLVDLKGVLARLFEEDGVRVETDVVGVLILGQRRERALGDKVAP